MRRLPLFAGVTSFALSVTAALAAEEGKGPVKLDENFNMAFHCALADGQLRQDAAEIAGALGIPGGSLVTRIAVSLVTLSEGSGRCVGVRLDDAGNPVGVKRPRFSHRSYDKDGKVILERLDSECTSPWAMVCIPKVVKGGKPAVGLTACFELKGSETKNGKPSSVVLRIARTSDGIPSAVEADESVKEESCSKRNF